MHVGVGDEVHLNELVRPARPHLQKSRPARSAVVIEISGRLEVVEILPAQLDDVRPLQHRQLQPRTVMVGEAYRLPVIALFFLGDVGSLPSSGQFQLDRHGVLVAQKNQLISLAGTVSSDREQLAVLHVLFRIRGVPPRIARRPADVKEMMVQIDHHIEVTSAILWQDVQISIQQCQPEIILVGVRHPQPGTLAIRKVGHTINSHVLRLITNT
mmetsp:Transcript_39647/g.119087  ORF Transcript_39647/g.119087 Transcript_39647/m.119087 type:complete len:213 (-) Transcript_39647:718-1356(-)